MFKIFKGVEDFFNNFQSKDNATQGRAIIRLVKLAAAFALLAGLLSL